MSAAAKEAVFECNGAILCSSSPAVWQADSAEAQQPKWPRPERFSRSSWLPVHRPVRQQHRQQLGPEARRTSYPSIQSIERFTERAANCQPSIASKPLEKKLCSSSFSFFLNFYCVLETKNTEKLL
ncbi:unnamed protein product [Sphagnum tenellum]